MDNDLQCSVDALVDGEGVLMNNDDIIQMAREAQLVYGSDRQILGSVTKFAALVAAAEREACAKVFDETKETLWESWDIAAAIRARGDKS